MTDRPRDPERVFEPAADETAGLALFEQRVAHPEVGSDLEAGSGVAVIKGARHAALERLAPKRPGQKARLLNIYRAIGPCTRNTAAAVLCGSEPPTPESMNCVQGRTAELKAAGQVCVMGYEAATGRELIGYVTPDYPGGPNE